MLARSPPIEERMQIILLALSPEDWLLDARHDCELTHTHKLARAERASQGGSGACVCYVTALTNQNDADDETHHLGAHPLRWSCEPSQWQPTATGGQERE